MKYQIGHSAYSDKNRLYVADNQRAAEKILIDRGVTRTEARKALKSAAAGSHVVANGIEVKGYIPYPLDVI